MKPLLILVRDEDPERRELVLTLLGRTDYQVMVAAEPTAATDAIASGRFGAVLLDLSLPQVNSGALVQALALSSESSTATESLEDVERRHLALVLQQTSNNKRKAAHLLGISRSTLLNKVRKYGLES
jgi:DNA-binding NtrC family response regulator